MQIKTQCKHKNNANTNILQIQVLLRRECIIEYSRHFQKYTSQTLSNVKFCKYTNALIRFTAESQNYLAVVTVHLIMTAQKSTNIQITDTMQIQTQTQCEYKYISNTSTN